MRLRKEGEKELTEPEMTGTETGTVQDQVQVHQVRQDHQEIIVIETMDGEEIALKMTEAEITEEMIGEMTDEMTEETTETGIETTEEIEDKFRTMDQGILLSY